MTEFIKVNGKSLTYKEAQQVNNTMVHYNLLRGWGYNHEDALKELNGDKKK